MLGQRQNKKLSPIERAARRLGPFFDSKFDQGGFLALQMLGKRKSMSSKGRRRLDPKANVGVPRAISSKRAEFKRENVLRDVALWEADAVIVVDNHMFMMGGTTSAPTDYVQNEDNMWLDIPMLPRDISPIAKQMFSAPIGLRVMQTHWGTRAGVTVGPSCYAYAETPLTLTATDGVYVPQSAFGRSNNSFETTADGRGQLGSLATGTKWYHQLGFQWNPIGVNLLPANDWAKCADYKYFRYKRFGMKITIDAPLFRTSQKYKTTTRIKYKQTGGTNPYTFSNVLVPGGAEQYMSEAAQMGESAIAFGAYEYMIVGAETLRNTNLPDLMGYSKKLNADTDGLGAVHVWNSLLETGVKAHRCTSNVIDLSWKPYSAELPLNSNVVSAPDYLHIEAGPIGPSVEISSLYRRSSTHITPGLVADNDSDCFQYLDKLPMLNGYNFKHYGPVVLLRFCMDPGADVQAFNRGTSDNVFIGAYCAGGSVSCGVSVKCWASYECFGENHQAFDIASVGSSWAQGVDPQTTTVDQGELQDNAGNDIDLIYAA